MRATPRHVPLRSTPQDNRHGPVAASTIAATGGTQTSSTTPRGGSSRETSGRATPLYASDWSDAEKEEELTDAYRRIARLEVENEKLRAAMRGQNTLMI